VKQQPLREQALEHHQLAPILGVLVATLSGQGFEVAKNSLDAAAAAHLPPFWAGWVQRLRQALVVAGPQGLEAEYVRLFLNPRGALCPPWEGAWQEEPRLFGPRHEGVLRWARQLGLEPREYLRESADHVSHELGLLGLMLTGQVPEEDIAAFWQEHIASWVPSFAAKLQEQANAPFFQLLGGFLASFLEAFPVTERCGSRASHTRAPV